MKKMLLLAALACHGGATLLTAQDKVATNQLTAQGVADRSLPFALSDEGKSLPINFGLDLAWLSDGNVRRGVSFMGADKVRIIRSSFTPTAPLVEGNLPADELATLNSRLRIIRNRLGAHTVVALNCDHPTVHDWYKGNPENWAALIDVTTRLHQEQGRRVVTVSPFNEPDYSYTGQGTISDFNAINLELRKNPRFDTIRISGGNTLNCDQALPWYNTLKANLDEGNTHQLAGEFDGYAAFYTAVRENGHHATNDELHNVMEAMVGAEYGMQTGIWWGTAEYARGEFCKASDGVRLAYAEHRPNWTAASVYRHEDGKKVQAFAGTSERQAIETSYRFLSKERDVYYEGYGPQREYTVVLPGGTGYQVGQTNAERVVNITWGDDIQPAINGRYCLINKASGQAMEVANGSTAAGANIRQYTKGSGTHQQWDVKPVDSRIGGDFSYFSLCAVHSGKMADVENWSLENTGNVIVWDSSNAEIQQWFFEYVEDGWFYIRSRHSAKCLEVPSNASNTVGANVRQNQPSGGDHQLWRLIPVTAAAEFMAPAAPEGLVATPQAASVRLDWTANSEADLASYTLFRKESAEGPYETIARNVTATSFVDHQANNSATTYYYALKAVDHTLNRSDYSNEVAAAPTGERGMIACLNFEGNTEDATLQRNHGAEYGTPSYTSGKMGEKALRLTGSSQFIQLPATIVNQEELTVATWIYFRGGTAGQAIFSFGHDDEDRISLSPRSSNSRMQFSLRTGGMEQTLESSSLAAFRWSHVAVSFGKSGVKLYLNGALVASDEHLVVEANLMKPSCNYIGRGLSSAPFLNAEIDDFTIFNYAMTADEVEDLYNTANSVEERMGVDEVDLAICVKEGVLGGIYTHPEHYSSTPYLQIMTLSGQLSHSCQILPNSQFTIPVKQLAKGVYLIKVTDGAKKLTRKVVIGE